MKYIGKKSFSVKTLCWYKFGKLFKFKPYCKSRYHIYEKSLSCTKYEFTTKKEWKYISHVTTFMCVYIFLYIKSYVVYLFSTLWRCVFGGVAETKERKQYHEQHNTDSTSPSPLFSKDRMFWVIFYRFKCLFVSILYKYLNCSPFKKIIYDKNPKIIGTGW